MSQARTAEAEAAASDARSKQAPVSRGPEGQKVIDDDETKDGGPNSPPDPAPEPPAQPKRSAQAVSESTAPDAPAPVSVEGFVATLSAEQRRTLLAALGGKQEPGAPKPRQELTLDERVSAMDPDDDFEFSDSDLEKIAKKAGVKASDIKAARVRQEHDFRGKALEPRYVRFYDHNGRSHVVEF